MTQNYQGSEYWVHNPHPFIFQIGENFGLRWYGFSYALGFMVAAWLLSIYFKRGKSLLNPEQQYSALLILILGTMAGGRLGYMLLYDTQTLLTAPWKFIQVWKGGMASHGGIVGLTCSIWYIARKYKYSFWKVGDLIVTIGAPGLFFGRIANFLNGELWGKTTTFKWAFIFQDAAPYGVPRHASQLYEAVLEGLVLFCFLQLRFWKSQISRLHPGQLSGEFFLAYGILRIIGEQFRQPDVGVTLILGLSRGIFYSSFMIVIGLWMIIRARKSTQT